MRWIDSSRLYARPSGYTSSTFTVKSVSFASDDTYRVGTIGPLSSVPSANGSLVNTSTSGRASVSRWSIDPALTPSWQHTLPPCDITGCDGSYVNVSGASRRGGPLVVSTPSPREVF